MQELPHELIDPSHEEMFSKGIHRVRWHKHVPGKGFTDAYFFHPNELRELFEKNGVETIEMATCEGLSSHLQEETNQIYEDKRKWKFWLNILLRTCNDPCILGLEEHLLYVGRKI